MIGIGKKCINSCLSLHVFCTGTSRSAGAFSPDASYVNKVKAGGKNVEKNLKHIATGALVAGADQVDRARYLPALSPLGNCIYSCMTFFFQFLNVNSYNLSYQGIRIPTFCQEQP